MMEDAHRFRQPRISNREWHG